MKIIKLTKFYHQAFTLVELLVVIAIIGILSTLSIVGLNSARAKARDSRRLSDVREIATALEMYYSDTGVYPLVASATGTLIGGLCLSDLGISSTCGTSVYLKKIPDDPQGRTHYWYMSSSRGASYQINFRLEQGSQGYPATSLVMVPGGIQESLYYGLIGWWPFNEGSGLLTSDASGHNNQGIISGALWEPHEPGWSLLFDNVDDGVNIPTNNFVGLYEYTMSAWVKPVGTHKNYTGTIISSGNWNSIHWAFGLGQNNEYIKFNRADGSRWVSFSYNVPLNQWTHVAVTRFNDKLNYFVNGQYIGQSSISASGELNSNATNTMIGRETYANGYFDFNGAIDDVRIYNRALSSEEIAILAQQN